ncbi:MAG: esterase, partial [Verrucomicrobia bacterium]|nr:esterase [Verrucomicrobiota bacterium]
MKPHHLLALILTALCLPAFAQNPRPRPVPVVSPEIKDDHSVTFRLKAPNAKEVAVRGQWSKTPLPLTRGDDGVWSASAGVINAGIWEYSFVVDGVAMIDPGNPALKPMREPRTSILHIRGNPPKIWDFEDAPHGTVNLHTYNSKSLGRLRELAVYTPPGYDKSSQSYATLYLQHGAGDNHATWTVHGKAHWIIDNLIAAKKARPMVVVMMDGHA